MNQWDQNSCFRITSNTLVKSFDNKVALAHIQTKRFHLLNPTATVIWNLIVAGKSIAELEKQMSDEFEVSPEKLSASIKDVLSTLTAEAFIELKA